MARKVKPEFQSIYENLSLDDLIQLQSEIKQRINKLKFKPKVKLLGKNGNIFNLMNLASKALKKIGLKTQSDEMMVKINNEAKDYDHALRIIEEYVNIQ